MANKHTPARHLFAFDLTASKENDRADNNPFVTARLSDALRKKQDEQSELVLNDLKKGVVFRPEFIAACVLGVLGAVALIVMTGLTESLTAAESFSQYGWLAVTGLVLIAGAIVLGIIGSRRAKTHTQSDDFSAITKNVESLGQLTTDELGIPEDTAAMDILPYQYKKAGDSEREIVEHGVYQNLELYVWSDGDCLCLTDHDSVMRVPISAFAGYRTVDERFKIFMWWKDEDHDKGEYKQYKIIEDNEFNYRLKTYYEVMIADGDTAYAMRVPCYDFPVLQKLVSLPCLDEQTDA